MGDVTGSVLQATSLFSLLNEIAVFVKKSYKRMKKWEAEMTKESKSKKRLQAIGETRWWSKDKSLDRVFGSFGKPDHDSCLYVKVLITLVSIAHDERSDGDIKVYR